MTATSNFFAWYFFGPNPGAIGGWLLFFVIGLAATIWMLYDSQKRKLETAGWKMAVVLTAALMLPTIIVRLQNFSEPLLNYLEPIFYLGLLGGVLPPVVAVGYYVTFQGETGRAAPPPPPIYDHRPPPAPPDRSVSGTPPPPSKPKASAYFVTGPGKNLQLYKGKTTIGRSPSNDIKFNDPKVSSRHAQVLEQNNHFTLKDLGSANGTFVNGNRVRSDVLLVHDDEIKFGPNTVVRFLASPR